jgi:hypothetical protein
MLATILVTALNLGSSQGPALATFQLVPPLLLSADVGGSQEDHEAETASGFRGDSVDRLERPEDAATAGSCWIVAGTTGGILLGGWTWIPIYYADGEKWGAAIGASVASTALLGIAGYFIGRAAQDGSTAAKIGVVALDVLGAGAWVGTVTAVLVALGKPTSTG